MSPEDLRALLERTGTTQAALAASVGVSTRTVERWLSGEIRIREPMARLIKSLWP